MHAILFLLKNSNRGQVIRVYRKNLTRSSSSSQDLYWNVLFTL